MDEAIANMKVQGQWKTHQLAINAIQFSPDKRYLASGDEEGLIVVRETATNKCLRLFKAARSVTCLKWDPSKPSLLFVGSSNGEINKIMISSKGPDHDKQALEIRPGWVHDICVNDKGTQIFVALGTKLMTAYREDSLEKSWGPMMPVPIPTMEEGIHPLIRQLHWNQGLIIVSFFFEGLGAIAYQSSLPFKREWVLKMRPGSVIGGSALSPSGKRLVVFNMMDGLDWYSTQKQKHLNTTSLIIGACLFMDVQLVDDDTAIIGHSGAILIATYGKCVMKIITCLDIPDPLQALDFAVIGGKLVIAGGSMPINDTLAKMVLLVEDPRGTSNRKRRSTIRKCGYYLIQTVIIFTTMAVIIILTVPTDKPNLSAAPIVPPPLEVPAVAFPKSNIAATAAAHREQTAVYTGIAPNEITKTATETTTKTETTTETATETTAETATVTTTETTALTATVTHKDANVLTVTETTAETATVTTTKTTALTATVTHTDANVLTVTETTAETTALTATVTHTDANVLTVTETTAETTTVTHTDGNVLTVTEMRAVLVTHTEVTSVAHTITETTTTTQTLASEVSAEHSGTAGGFLYPFGAFVLALCAVALYTGLGGKDPIHSCPAQTELERIRASMVRMQEGHPLREDGDQDERPSEHSTAGQADPVSNNEEAPGTSERAEGRERHEDDGVYTGTGRTGEGSPPREKTPAESTPLPSGTQQARGVASREEGNDPPVVETENVDTNDADPTTIPPIGPNEGAHITEPTPAGEGVFAEEDMSAEDEVGASAENSTENKETSGTKPTADPEAGPNEGAPATEPPSAKDTFSDGLSVEDATGTNGTKSTVIPESGPDEGAPAAGDTVFEGASAEDGTDASTRGTSGGGDTFTANESKEGINVDPTVEASGRADASVNNASRGEDGSTKGTEKVTDTTMNDTSTSEDPTKENADFTAEAETGDVEETESGLGETGAEGNDGDEEKKVKPAARGKKGVAKATGPLRRAARLQEVAQSTAKPTDAAKPTNTTEAAKAAAPATKAGKKPNVPKAADVLSAGKGQSKKGSWI